MRAALLPLPLAALRIDAEIVAALAQAGLKCIADVLDRPRAPLAARFGEDFVRRLDQALGREDEPITPRLPVPAVVAEQRFAEPIAREDDVLGTIEHLAQRARRACWSGAAKARGCLQVALFRTDGKVHPHRGRHRRAAARSARASARCSPSGSPCSATTAIRASASTWCGSSALVTERSDPVQTGLADGRSRARSWRI